MSSRLSVPIISENLYKRYVIDYNFSEMTGQKSETLLTMYFSKNYP